jgi:transcriptional regulator with XRE-family HTH domain
MGKAEKVRILLVKQGTISEAKLARQMGISPQALSRKMNKEKFTSADMEKFAKCVFSLSQVLTVALSYYSIRN